MQWQHAIATKYLLVNKQVDIVWRKEIWHCTNNYFKIQWSYRNIGRCGMQGLGIVGIVLFCKENSENWVELSNRIFSVCSVQTDVDVPCIQTRTSCVAVACATLHEQLTINAFDDPSIPSTIVVVWRISAGGKHSSSISGVWEYSFTCSAHTRDRARMFFNLH
jgi:hypothetical protein